MKKVYLRKGVFLVHKYRIEKTLGEGGFGITYLAKDESLCQEVVIKEYFPMELAGREDDGKTVSLPREKNDRKKFLRGRKDFLLEARRMSRLFDIEEVVKILGWFEENQTAYLVMEYVRGISLDRYLQSQDIPFSFRQAWTFLRPVAEALEKMHKKGIIHRDINPQNLMVQENGKIKIIDFGASRPYLDTEKTMTILIKKGYAPPEQYLKKGRQGPWTDLYAFCATLYEMITGVRPESSSGRIQKDELYLPSAYGAEILPEEEEVLCRGLELNPQKRFRNMKDLIQALESVKEEKKGNRSFFLVLGISIAAGLCMAVGVLFYVFSQNFVQEEAVSYAGNYGRQTEKYKEYIEFVKEHTVSVQVGEKDPLYPYQGRSLIYTLEEEAVEEWGEPCNRLRLDGKADEFLKWMDQSGYTLNKIETTEKTATVEILRYGAVITDFSTSELYETEDGLRLSVRKDSVNGDLFQISFEVREKRIEEIQQIMAETAEFLTRDDSFDRETALEAIKKLENRNQDDGWMGGEYHYWLVSVENKTEGITAWVIGPNKAEFGYAAYYWP